jgi:hypothetical protein
MVMAAVSRRLMAGIQLIRLLIYARQVHDHRECVTMDPRDSSLSFARQRPDFDVEEGASVAVLKPRALERYRVSRHREHNATHRIGQRTSVLHVGKRHGLRPNLRANNHLGNFQNAGVTGE